MKNPQLNVLFTSVNQVAGIFVLWLGLSPGAEAVSLHHHRAICDESWRDRIHNNSYLYTGSNHPATTFPKRPLEGYLEKFSYFPGDQMNLLVNGDRIKYSVVLKRHHFGNPITVLEIKDLTAILQATRCDSYQYGAGWKSGFKLSLPKSLPSGMYSLTLVPSKTDAADSSAFIIPFVVKALTPTASILVLSSSITWTAYNGWGGGCTYKDYSSDQAPSGGVSILSFARPIIAEDPEAGKWHEAGGEMYVLKWLEREGYAYDVISELDLHRNPSILEKYKTFVINTHSEYWTKEMVNGLKGYLNQGGAVANLGGNFIYYKAEIKGDQVEILRGRGREGTRHTFEGDVGGKWKDIGTPESSLLGTILDGHFELGEAGFSVVTPDHWIFNGTNLRRGALFGERGTNVPEVLAADSWNNNAGASGGEVNIIDGSSPKDVIRLATGANPGGGADMVYFENSHHGRVFNASSITYGGTLLSDPTMTRIQRNVFDAFTKEQK